MRSYVDQYICIYYWIYKVIFYAQNTLKYKFHEKAKLIWKMTNTRWEFVKLFAFFEIVRVAHMYNLEKKAKKANNFANRWDSQSAILGRIRTVHAVLNIGTQPRSVIKRE